jgi:hypothetical protein
VTIGHTASSSNQNLLCDSDAGCCPPESLESITDGQLNAELVFRGSSYQKTPGASYAPFAGPADREEQIRHALPGCSARSCVRAGNCGQRP